jgi:hypothetical protein
MTRFAMSEPDPAPYDVNPEVEAEAVRQEQWAIFVASLRDYAFHDGWAEVLTAVTEAFDGFIGTAITMQIREFAEAYGWPDTLRALAQAWQADEQAKREVMDRR